MEVSKELLQYISSVAIAHDCKVIVLPNSDWDEEKINALCIAMRKILDGGAIC